MRLRAVAGAALAGLVLLAPVAAAQTPPVAPPPPPAAAGTLALAVDGATRDGSDRVVLAGARWAVRGTVSPWVPGQRVTVRLYRGSRKLAARSVAVRRSGARGVFTVRYRAGRPGAVHVRAVHRATPELATLQARAPRVEVLRASAGPGSRGRAVRLLQAGLDAMRFAVPRTGRYDGGTARAVMAYRKVNGLRRLGTADATVLRRVIARRGAFRPRHPRGGRHLEADLSRQVLALVDGGRVVRTYTTSSGAPATPTVRGAFRVYRKDLGTNAIGMVHSSYFIRGYAVHGYASVPPYNASHGCLRVPIPDALSIYNWLRMGDRVYVYA